MERAHPSAGRLDGRDGELRFVVHGTDLEGEVELRQVRLCAEDGGLNSHFVYAAAGIYGGAAHALTIQAQLAATLSHASAPVSIEVRER